MTFVLVGVPASLIIGCIIAKNREYRLAFIMVMWGTVVSFAVYIVSYSTKESWFVTLTSGLIGFTLVPNTPVSYALALELTFPVG